MTSEERDIQRKPRVLQHAEKIGNARGLCPLVKAGSSKPSTASSARNV